MADQRLRKRADGGFVIPPGSQVVLTVVKQVGDSFRKPGSVGVVLESPPHNGLEYRVRFVDGATVDASIDELQLRREEIDNQLDDVDERPYWSNIIYRCVVGSRAYGLSNEDSDDDVRGIFLCPAADHWSLRAVPEQLERCDDQHDEVYWELEKFLKLALKANPNVLETLWTPLVVEADETARALREMRSEFLSRHIYKTYAGYVLSQFRRMDNASKKGKYRPKHAMHLIRLLYTGAVALRTGEIQVEVSARRDELLAIRSGAWTYERVREHALRLEREFQCAFQETDLPEQPDIDRVDEFLIEARRRAASE
ncbi:MAG: nucleotidyltransferase domain-containing protein [Pirellulaceae bacterium]|jgi:hypothetical protein|nr:nucleotidyltransferase domain-containing protein [Pirellulaceae bacterium]MDP7014906.1 nucleotidyltransferase domain-containing protein [Pirellulaceae bacterium]